jgi:hypothetical protein
LPTSDAITFSSASAACSSASASVGSHRDPAPHLAVDLYRVLDAVLNQVGRVGNREQTVGQRRTRHFLGRVGCGMKPLGEDRREISDIGLGNSQHWNLMASGKLDLVLGFRHVSRILAAPHLSDGSFVRVSADHLDVPLFWQCWKLDSPIVARITEAVTSAADEMRPRAN